MVDSPEYRLWHRSPRCALHLGRLETPTIAIARPANLVLQRAASDVCIAQRTGPRPERRLPLQCAHGSASAADAGNASAVSGGCAGLDAETGVGTPWSCARR